MSSCLGPGTRLMRLYRRLYQRFGPQHWWPAQTPFEVSVGAILTQNTSWVNVEKAICRLKEHRLLEPRRMAAVPSSRLASLIRSSGYYTVKARRLKHLLAFFGPDCGADLRQFAGQDVRPLRAQLLQVNGIGPETADSILLYAFNKPVFVVDAYTRRIFSRHGLIPDGAGYDQAQQLCMRYLKRDARFFNEFHALLVRLGKEYCRKRAPACSSCPLAGLK